MSFKKEKKNKADPSKPSKLGLIFDIHNPLNSRPRFNKKAQFITNLMLNDKIKNQFKKIPK
jgi:hypothetical protein